MHNFFKIFPNAGNVLKSFQGKILQITLFPMESVWSVGWVFATIMFVIVLHSYSNGCKLSIWYVWSLSSRACPHARWTTTFGDAILGS